MNRTYKPGEFARIVNRSVATLRAWDRSGKLKPKRLPSGHRYYTDADIEIALSINSSREFRKYNVIYCRVSSPKQRADLARQVEAMEAFCLGAGIEIYDIITEIGGGLNYKRPKFLELLVRVENREVGKIVVAHKDRLVRFGFEYFEHFVETHGGNIVIANQQSMSPQQELTEDLMAVIHCFSCRLYGVRKYKKEIETKILEHKLD